MSARPHYDPAEALEYLLAHGAVRYTEERGVTHLPCSLTPWAGPTEFVEETKSLTRLYTTLYHRVAQDDDFLHRELEKTRAADDFVESLFQAKNRERAGKPCLFLNRNDCMPALSDQPGVLWPKQVEMNLMASALGEASSVVSRMHRFLSQHDSSSVREHWAGRDLANALAEGYRLSGSDGIILLLIPIGEVSVFDQRILEARLVAEHGLPTLKASLEELGEVGEIRGGDLYFKGHKVSIAYFRTGYAPRHYTNAHAWEARGLIEESSAISVPSARTQLANTKLIQLVLADVDVLGRFVEKDEAQRLIRSCVRFTKLDAIFRSNDGSEALGREVALAHPEDWVLKPHREGGGNNFFGTDIVNEIQKMSPEKSDAYILMENIRQPVFDSVRMVDGEAISCRCFTELGFFGTAYFENAEGEPAFNESKGYLLRTKDESMNEGLVLGGFSFLDAIVDPDSL